MKHVYFEIVVKVSETERHWDDNAHGRASEEVSMPALALTDVVVSKIFNQVLNVAEKEYQANLAKLELERKEAEEAEQESGTEVLTTK